MQTLVLVGLSGAGKSATLHMLEDLDYFAIDPVLPHLASDVLKELQPHYCRVAMGLEVSRPTFLEDCLLLLPRLQEQAVPVVFLEAADAVLVRRFSANRRRHPLYAHAEGLLAAIQQERCWLQPLREAADYILDTSALDLNQLRAKLEQLVQGIPPLTVTLTSFGFKHGLPLDANLVFDIRFLPNPYYVPDLRARTGQETPVAEYVFADPLAQTTYTGLRDLIAAWLPQYRAERRSQVVIAIGCTGGQHRSVAFVERLAQDLATECTGLLWQIAHCHMQQSQADHHAG